jgi:predicted alpha/beta superfamily hydrolase
MNVIFQATFLFIVVITGLSHKATANSCLFQNENYRVSHTPRPTGEAPGPGTLVFHHGMQGPGIKPRDVVVWLPPNYQQDTDLHFPVLYMHDGQNIFDPETSYAGVSWRAHEIADSLTATGEIEPMIIVGIYNTPDRLAEYTPGPLGELYMSFVTEVLKPFIDRQYRTMPGRGFTITAGASAGGTISFMLAWQHNEVFSKAICMSPALKYTHNEYPIDVVSMVEDHEGPRKDIFLYIDNGGVGLEERLQPGIDQMMQALRQQGYREGESFVWFRDPQAEHNEAAWSRRLPTALRIIFQNL